MDSAALLPGPEAYITKALIYSILQQYQAWTLPPTILLKYDEYKTVKIALAVH